MHVVAVDGVQVLHVDDVRVGVGVGVVLLLTASFLLKSDLGDLPRKGIPREE